MTSDHSNRDRDRTADRIDTAIDRRAFVAAGGTVGATLLAGCVSDAAPTDGSSGESPDDEETEETEDAGGDGENFRLLVSDRPADIGDFDSLEVTFDSARIFDGGGESDEGDGEESDGGDESNPEGDESATDGEESSENETEAEDETESESDDEADADDDDGDDTEEADDGEADDADDADDGVERRRGFYWLDLEGATVDLTQVVGERAVSVFEGGLAPGSYRKIELHVDDIEGIVDGEAASVKVPSEKLQITHPFEVSADDPLEFVFDINVVKKGKGNDYNLKPVISESGVAGEDVAVERVDEDDNEDPDDDEENESETDEEGSETTDGDGSDASDDGADADGAEADADGGDGSENDSSQ